MTLVSVCIPTYNSAKYIVECLDSLLNQTLDNFEIIISDNCSTDNTVELVRNKKIKNLKIYKNSKNMGIAKNFNIVCNLADGKYIKLLPSDDKITKDSLEKSVKYFEKHQDISLVVSSKKIINQSSKIILKNVSSFSEGIHVGKDVIWKILNSGRNPLGEPTVAMFKKDNFIEVGGFNENYKLTLDIDLWVRLLEKGNLYFIEKPLGYFRIHSKSQSLERNIYKNYLEWLHDFQDKFDISRQRRIFIIMKVRFFNIAKQLFYLFLRIR